MVLISLIGYTQLTSDFELDSDNWHSEGDGDYYWESGTENPGSCFRVDDATGDISLPIVIWMERQITWIKMING